MPVPDEAELLIPVTVALVQVKVVPEVGLVGLKTNGCPLQTVGGLGVFVVSRGGWVTMTVTFCELIQPLAVRV